MCPLETRDHHIEIRSVNAAGAVAAAAAPAADAAMRLVLDSFIIVFMQV